MSVATTTGAMAHKGEDVDQELIGYLTAMRIEDEALAMALQKERERTESQLEAIHRQNNFRIDEAHIREANIAEAQFLADSQEQERKWIKRRQEEEAATLKEEEEDRRILDRLMAEFKSLKLGVRQRQQASERVMAVKRRLAERRVTVQLRTQAIEMRQQRERKALQDSHARIIKNMSIYRNLLLKEYEDIELEKAVAEQSDDADRLRQVELERLEGDKLHEAKMLQLKLRMQKEVEQLREGHLLLLKHMAKTSDLELDQTEEMETLIAEQKVQELELEGEQKREKENTEEILEQQIDQLKAFQTQRHLQIKAARILAAQRHEARQLTRQHKIAAKQRERQFFENEELIKEGHAEIDEGDEVASGDGGDNDNRRKSIDSSVASGSVAGASEYSEVSELSETTAELNQATGAEEDKAYFEANAEIEEQLRKNRVQMEDLAKKHIQAMETLRIQQREIRDGTKREHMDAMGRLQQEMEEEYKSLKTQHHQEMAALLKVQSTADQLEADNAVSNELLYGMLPRYVADALKMGRPMEPKDFECITILYSDIVQFTNLTAKSNSQQIVSLLNRLYTAFDSILDDYTDVYKTETIGDAYQIVGGLNSNDRDFKKYASEVVDCALRFIQAVREMDMSDQVQKELFIRIGIHSGPAVGGVAGITMPKFSLFGDTVAIANQMETKSMPNRIHVSQATYDLVKDMYEVEPREGSLALEGGIETKGYWLKGKKGGGNSTPVAGNRRRSTLTSRKGVQFG